jgi:hypothetical protein
LNLGLRSQKLLLGVLAFQGDMAICKSPVRIYTFFFNQGIFRKIGYVTQALPEMLYLTKMPI